MATINEVLLRADELRANAFSAVRKGYFTAWASFASTVGTDYEDAKAGGAGAGGKTPAGHDAERTGRIWA